MKDNVNDTSKPTLQELLENDPEFAAVFRAGLEQALAELDKLDEDE